MAISTDLPGANQGDSSVAYISDRLKLDSNSDYLPFKNQLKTEHSQMPEQIYKNSFKNNNN